MPVEASADGASPSGPAAGNEPPVAGNEETPATEAAAPETKPEPEAKPEEKTEEPEAAPALTLDSYKDLKVPDTITSDSALIGEFKQMALEDKLPPEAAQKYVNLFEKTLTSTVESLAKAQQDAFTKTTEGWLTESLALPEFQGEREATTKAFLSQLVEEFGSPEAAQALAATGAGNHPAVVKYILSLGQALIEGEPTGAPGVVVPQSSGRPRTLGEGLYPQRN